jgi:acetyl esterase/lipase
VVLVHGGGWDSRDRSDMAGVAEKLAARGYVVANIGYRLAPAHLHPAQLEDTRAAIRWLRANAARLRVNPERVGGWGYSAGGHLVALAATLDGPPESRLQAIVAGGTPSDLPHYPISPIITRFIGAPFAQAGDAWLAASPVTHVDAGDPPVFQYHGTWDRLVYVDDAHTFKAALDRAGVPNELYLVRGGGHITTFLLGFGAEAAAIAFLDRHLR